MSKDTEELIFIGIGVFLLLNVLSNNGGGAAALTQARLSAGNNATYANDAASVAITAISDFSG